MSVVRFLGFIVDGQKVTFSDQNCHHDIDLRQGYGLDRAAIADLACQVARLMARQDQLEQQVADSMLSDAMSEEKPKRKVIVVDSCWSCPHHFRGTNSCSHEKVGGHPMCNVSTYGEFPPKFCPLEDAK